MKIAIINGPNINLLGTREPEIYGKVTLDDIEAELNEYTKEKDIELIFYQSNHQGEIINYIQSIMDTIDGVIINPAAYSLTGYGILDSLTALNTPFVEVHLSNIFSRGELHNKSIFSQKAIGQIVGFKDYVYKLGLLAIINHIEKNRSRKYL